MCVSPVVMSYLSEVIVENVSNDKVNAIIMFLIRIWNPNGFTWAWSQFSLHFTMC